MELEKEEEDSSRESWDSVDVEDNNCHEIAAAKCLFIGSKHFSPILALGCNDLKIPVAGAPCYHSIAEFADCIPNLEIEGKPPPPFPISRKPKKVLSRMRVSQTLNSPVIKLSEARTVTSISGCSPLISTSPSANKSREDTKSKPTDGPICPIPGRRFLPHQLPVAPTQKNKPNVLTLMDEYTGPLSALNEARLKFRRIRVWRRDEFGIRGYCTGSILCFDKHWNLILNDVDEIFQRRRGARLGNRKMDLDGEERQEFKSGELLSEYSKRARRKRESQETSPIQNPPLIRKGTRTGYLINGPEDALEVCRIGIQTLLLKGIEKEKLKTDRGKADSSPSNDSENEPHVTKSTLRKKQLVILRKAETDFLGNK